MPASCRTSATSRLLPMPASPVTVTARAGAGLVVRECLGQLRRLLRPADELGLAPKGRRTGADLLLDAVRLDRLRLALDHERRHRFGRERRARPVDTAA